MSSKTCLIIGGGLAGLMAGTVLQRNNIAVTILDKGRGIGGRLASRRIANSQGEKGVFDYGAQFFTVRDVRFRRWTEQWLKEGWIREWTDKFEATGRNGRLAAEPRFCGTVSTRQIAQNLAEPLAVQPRTRIVGIDWTSTAWMLVDDQGNRFESDIVISTLPVPQALDLFRESDLTLPKTELEQLEHVSYLPCFAALILPDRPSNIPKPGGVKLDGSPLEWLGDNQQKGISPIPAVTAHLGREYSREHFDDDPATIVDHIRDAASEWVDTRDAILQLHRWRYSQPNTLHPGPFLAFEAPGPLVLAGDAFVAPRVEGAVLSGLEAAAHLLETHRS